MCPKDAGNILSGDELGWRLAGIADGEGCFHIRPSAKGIAYQCTFTIGLRADDKPLLELLRDSTRVGRIHDVTPTERALKSRPGTNPQATWQISSKSDCLSLVRLFDRYPPISKKAREYRVWRRAVVAWQDCRWGLMRECHLAMQMLRVFSTTELDDVEILDDQLALEVGK